MQLFISKFVACFCCCGKYIGACDRYSESKNMYDQFTCTNFEVLSTTLGKTVKTFFSDTVNALLHRKTLIQL